MLGSMLGFKSPAPIPKCDETDVFWPTCGLHVDPTCLPVRYELPGRTYFERAAGVKWAVTLYRDHIVLWRDAAFMRHEPIVVPMAEFESVAVRAAQADGDRFRMTISLRNTVRGMEIPVYSADHTADVAALWDAWGRTLDLPLEIVDADGTIRTPGDALPREAAIGRVVRRVRDRRAVQRPGQVGGRRALLAGRRMLDPVR